MTKTEFKDDGIIYSRGEKVCKYRAGDKVTILEEISEDLLNIIITEGEANGMVMAADKKLFKL